MQHHRTSSLGKGQSSVITYPVVLPAPSSIDGDATICWSARQPVRGDDAEMNPEAGTETQRPNKTEDALTLYGRASGLSGLSAALVAQSSP
jgi:hypothetical protein